MARPISTGTITFGLVSIPVRLFSATSSKSVSFNLLHGKDNSRIQQKVYCPVDDKIVDRSELVRGYQVEKDRYVTFTDDELKQLEAQGDHAIDISEFIPLAEIDPLYFEESYYLGCEPTSAKAYRLLAEAMGTTNRVALASYTMRGKEHLVLLRPYRKGLMMHTLYYADEVRPVDEVERGAEAAVKDAELELAKRLIGELTVDKLDLDKYKDNYRERVLEAAEKKMQGQEVTEAPPETRKAQVIDLMAALKASLEKRGSKGEEAEEEQEVKAKVVRSEARAPREKRRAGGKK